jgi:hypothetical protein
VVGFARALFKDTDETLLKIARPIMLEGITNFVTRADLMDRALIFAAEPLASRKTERALLAEFERVRPGIFGALLDQLAIGIQRLPDTHLARLRNVGCSLRARRIRDGLRGQSSGRDRRHPGA